MRGRQRLMSGLDRLLTIVVTATITSLVWIVAGPALLERADSADSAVSGAVSSGGAGPVPAGLPQQRQVTAPGMPQARGTIAPGAALAIPVAGVAANALTDTWNAERGGGTRAHEAIDIMAPVGTPVLAAAPGTVEKLFLSDDGGKTIYVRSQDRRMIHYYAHLDAYAQGLGEGQRIGQGQVLGTVGSSGNADPAAPHLHFALFATTPQAGWSETTKPINPYPLLTGGG